MSPITAAADRSPYVEAPITYVVAGEKAVFYPAERDRSYWPRDMHKVRISSMRPVSESLDLETNGFVLLHEPTGVKNFYDSQEVKQVYYPEIINLVKRLNGAEEVIAFGEVARTDNRDAVQGQLPSYGAHVDYGDYTVREFAENVLGKTAAQKLLKLRYVLINLWRPITPVYRTPLAVCDASTVVRSDLNDSEIRGGLMDPDRPPLYGFNLSYNPDHRWYYVPEMQPDEILAFKLYDSDSGRVQWTGHTAFDDPGAPPEAPPRESIEIRTISFIRPA